MGKKSEKLKGNLMKKCSVDQNETNERVNKKHSRILKANLHEHKKDGRCKDYMSLEERKFSNIISELNLKIVYMDGDGNCMFRSIADQLQGDPEAHFQYRTQIMDYISNHADHFRLFVEDDESFDEYVERMRHDGEWGGHPELYAASQCLERDIIIHQVGGPRLRLAGGEGNRGELHLSYHGEQHYNSIRLESDPGHCPALPVRLTSACPTSGNNSKADHRPSATQAEVRSAVPWLPVEAVDWALRNCGDDVAACVELLISDPDGYLTAVNESLDEHVTDTSTGPGVFNRDAPRGPDADESSGSAHTDTTNQPTAATSTSTKPVVGLQTSRRNSSALTKATAMSKKEKRKIAKGNRSQVKPSGTGDGNGGGSSTGGEGKCVVGTAVGAGGVFEVLL